MDASVIPPLQEIETEIRSFEAAANPIHYLIARMIGKLASKECVVSALSLLNPQLLRVHIARRI
jgi:hypothetical protein